MNFSASSGTLAANAGAVVVGKQAIATLALLDIAGNAQLSGSGEILGSNMTYESSAASTFAGNIVGTGLLTMNGTGGTLILSGSNTYSGGTEVLAGTLIATSNQSLPAGGSLTIGAGGMFHFRPDPGWHAGRRLVADGFRCGRRSRARNAVAVGQRLGGSAGLRLEKAEALLNS